MLTQLTDSQVYLRCLETIFKNQMYENQYLQTKISIHNISANSKRFLDLKNTLKHKTS